MCLLKALLSCFKSWVRACLLGGMAEMWTSSQPAMRAVTWCTANLSRQWPRVWHPHMAPKNDSFKKKENGFQFRETEEDSVLSHIPSKWWSSFHHLPQPLLVAAMLTIALELEKLHARPKSPGPDPQTYAQLICTKNFWNFKIQNTVSTIKSELGNLKEGSEMITSKSPRRKTSSSTNEPVSKLWALRNWGWIESAPRLQHFSLQCFCEEQCTLVSEISGMNPGSDSEWQTC